MSYSTATGVFKSHDRKVTRFYDSRTATECAAYLVPHLQPHYSILDIGCGPGGITRDFARLCPEGKTIGVDITTEIVAQATDRYCRQKTTDQDDNKDGDNGGNELPPPHNLTFTIANAQDLSQFPDNSFDVVHAHMVLMHLADPRTALSEMYRVCKSNGGIIATRDFADWDASSENDSLIVYPDRNPKLRELFDRVGVLMRMGGNVDVSRRKVEWLQELCGVADKDIVVGESLMVLDCECIRPFPAVF